MSTATTEPKTLPRLKQRYREEIRAALQQEFSIANVMQTPGLVKVVVNMGVGEAARDSKLIDGAVKDLLLQLAAFGLHLARLDVRLAADAIAGSVARDLPELAGADEPQRRKILAAHIEAAHADQFGPICPPTEALQS